MTTDQKREEIRNILCSMGYKEHDANRAIEAGIYDVSIAVEFLSTPVNPQPPKKHYNTSSSNRRTTSASTSSASVHVPTTTPKSRGISKARDSLDRNDKSRSLVSSVTQGHTIVASEAGQSELERALRLSEREQEERDTAEALKRSKQQTSAPPEQDPELLRAIEESLMENNVYGVPVNERAVSWRSHAYPDIMDRVRKDLEQPVGLRNIGNTCYLNSLLQVYYHLPEFRYAIMAFRPPDELIDVSTDSNVIPDLQQQQQQQPSVEMPPEDMSKEISPADRLEKKLSAAQPVQSFDTPPNADQFMNPVEIDSEMSGNNLEKKDDNAAVRNAVQFVVELQKLFAMMALGNQNCADPTGVMHAMRDPDGNPIVIGAQQDASEFNHLFLDIVERGLKSMNAIARRVESGPSREDDPTGPEENNSLTNNVVKELFTAQFRQEVRRCGEDHAVRNGDEKTVPEPFTVGETNVIIVDATTKQYRDLHSGLDDFAYASVDTGPTSSQAEASLAVNAESSGHHGAEMQTSQPPVDAKMDSVIPLAASKGLKSVWFTQMPPVVVIYLQRVRYNRNTSQAEKIHDQYDFFTEISFERYLERNKDMSIQAREIVLGIRREKENLVQLLHRYRSFPMGSVSANKQEDDMKMPTADFSGSNEHRGGTQDSDGDINLGCNYLQNGADVQRSSEEYQDTYFSAARRVEARLLEALQPSSNMFKVDGLSNEQVSASIEVLRKLVNMDKKKYESYEAELRSLAEKEKAAYEDLDSSKYSLHAVLVHDGAPSGGHYWTFIRNWSAMEESARWMKLSDSVVSYVSEKDMLSWSVGGKSMASAYCLIYTIGSSLEGNMERSRSVAVESKLLLPRVRIDEVERASADFDREVKELNAGKGR